ncbi:MAG: hypothetical protein CUN55_13625, partial [Phototrophicales bacterium]
GLHHAHRHGIIHRDIKPSNIFFSKDHRVVIGDFGLAKDIDTTATRTIDAEGGIAGTPSYLSPEQIQGEATDPRSDIYALGVIMYQLLAGERPYQGELHAVLVQHLQAPVPDLSEVRPDLPIQASQIIKRAMAKKPEERYQTMKEFIQDIDALLNKITDSDRTIIVASPNEISQSLTSFINLPAIKLRDQQTQSQAKPAWRTVGQYAPLVLILALIIGGLAFGASGLLNSRSDENNDSTALDPLSKIAVANPNEVLIIISQMNDDETDIDVGEFIRQQLQNGEISTILANQIRIEQLPIAIEDEDQAHALSMESGAEIVIWGMRNAAGWNLHVHAAHHPPNSIEDLHLLVVEGDRYAAQLVQEVPLLVDYYTRILLISTMAQRDQLVETFWLIFSFRKFTETSILALAQRPLDQDVLRIFVDIIDGNYQRADQNITELLLNAPNDLTLLLIRWAANSLDDQLSQAVRDAERISDLLGEDKDFPHTLRTTTYYVFGEGDKVLSSIQPILDSDSSTARFGQNQAVEVMIHNGDFAEALAYANRDKVTFLGRLLLIYAIQGDEASIRANIPEYLDQRADRFLQDANLFFQEIKPENYHPVSFSTTIFNAQLENQPTLARLTAAFALSLHPTDYLLNWLQGNIFAENGDFTDAYKHYEIAAENAPVPFPIARLEQARLVLKGRGAIEDAADVCELLEEAHTQANTDPDFYAVLLEQIAALQTQANCEA